VPAHFEMTSGRGREDMGAEEPQAAPTRNKHAAFRMDKGLTNAPKRPHRHASLRHQAPILQEVEIPDEAMVPDHFRHIVHVEDHTEQEKRLFAISGGRARRHANQRWASSEVGSIMGRKDPPAPEPSREMVPDEPEGMPFDVKAKLDPWIMFARDSYGNGYSPGVYANGARAISEGVAINHSGGSSYMYAMGNLPGGLDL